MGVRKRATRTILAIQAAVTAVAFLGTSLWVGDHAAWSALTGGAIGLVTTGFFAFWVFAGGPEQPAQKVVRRFYIGEVQKIGLTVVLLIVAIVWLEVAFLPMFLTYMATLLAFWVGLLPALDGAGE